MSEGKKTPEERDTEMQARFDEAAVDLDLELADSDDERCSVGVAIVPVVPSDPVAYAGRLPNPPKFNDDDKARIREIITEFESVHPDNLLDVWKSLATEPFVAVGSHWVMPLDRDVIRRGLESSEFAAQQILFPPCRPRRNVEITDWNMVHLGRTKTVVTYHVKEEYQNGKTFAGNSAAVLMKTSEAEWKITVYTKHNRFDDFNPVED